MKCRVTDGLKARVSSRVTQISAKLQSQLTDQQMTVSRKAFAIMFACDILFSSQCPNALICREIRKIRVQIRDATNTSII